MAFAVAIGESKSEVICKKVLPTQAPSAIMCVDPTHFFEFMTAGLPGKAEFKAELNAGFRATGERGSEFDLKLIEVDGHISDERQENFSLLFRAPITMPPEQGIYQMTNETLGELDIFIVPIRNDDDGLYFQAVFNQLL